MNPDQFVKKFTEILRKLINEELVKRELQLYENYLKMLGRSKRTIRDRVSYLRRFLKSGLPLNSDGILAFLSSIKGEGKTHAVKALRIYFKLKGRRDLLEIIKTPKSRQSLTYSPSLEEVKAVFEEIDWLPAQSYYVLLSESGLRPGEIYELELAEIDLNTRISNLKIRGLDFEDRIAAPLKSTSSKRAFCSFFTSKKIVQDYIKDYHIQDKLFPFSRKKLREEIYKAMDKALGRQFQLYALRRFWTTEMYRRGIRELTIDMLQGRKPKLYRIMLDHYLKLTLRDLRNEYDQAGLRIGG